MFFSFVNIVSATYGSHFDSGLGHLGSNSGSSNYGSHAINDNNWYSNRFSSACDGVYGTGSHYGANWNSNGSNHGLGSTYGPGSSYGATNASRSDFTHSYGSGPGATRSYGSGNTTYGNARGDGNKNKDHLVRY